MFKKIAISTIALVAFSAQADTYGGIEGGLGFVDTNAASTAQSLANLAGSTVTYTSDRGAFVGRAFISYDVNSTVAVEIGGFATTNASNTYVLSGVSAKENYSATGVDTSAVLKIADTGFFGKLGMHYSQAKGNASATNGITTYRSSGDASGSGLMAGIGYQAKLSEGVFWRTTYSYYDKVGGVSGANINLFSLGIVKKF